MVNPVRTIPSGRRDKIVAPAPLRFAGRNPPHTAAYDNRDRQLIAYRLNGIDKHTVIDLRHHNGNQFAAPGRQPRQRIGDIAGGLDRRSTFSTVLGRTSCGVFSARLTVIEDNPPRGRHLLGVGGAGREVFDM
jgi:hypothetical protein